MAKPKDNADKAPEAITQEPNVPSIEQVNDVKSDLEETKEEITQVEETETKVTDEVKLDEEKESTQEVISIEMGFKEEVTPPNPNDVKFKVEYKKDFEGKKRHIEGSIITISKESAQMFEKSGIGHIVK